MHSFVRRIHEGMMTEEELNERLEDGEDELNLSIEKWERVSSADNWDTLMKMDSGDRIAFIGANSCGLCSKYAGISFGSTTCGKCPLIILGPFIDGIAICKDSNHPWSKAENALILGDHVGFVTNANRLISIMKTEKGARSEKGGSSVWEGMDFIPQLGGLVKPKKKKIRLEVHEDGKKAEEEPLWLKLGRGMDDGIKLEVVDRTGNHVSCGCILTITTDGRIYRHDDVNNTLGLNLDDRKRVKLVGEEE